MLDYQVLNIIRPQSNIKLRQLRPPHKTFGLFLPHPAHSDLNPGVESGLHEGQNFTVARICDKSFRANIKHPKLNAASFDMLSTISATAPDLSMCSFAERLDSRGVAEAVFMQEIIESKRQSLCSEMGSFSSKSLLGV